MTRMLSPHFSYLEMTTSQTAVRHGLDNTPDAASLRNLKRLCAALEVVRSALGDQAVHISSGYRSPAVNAKLSGSSKTSFHMKGLAADFYVPGFGTNLQTARAVARLDIPIDQLIHEGGWVHLGLCEAGKTPRRELLSLAPDGSYIDGLVACA